MSAAGDHASFLSGETGEVAGLRHRLKARAKDLLLDAELLARGRSLDRLAAASPPRRVLALSIYRTRAALLSAAVRELRASRHELTVALGSMGDPAPELAGDTVATQLAGGKFENLNALLERAGGEFDWLLVVDDDVALPRRFLDRFVAVCERFGLALAQPAQTLTSHAAWSVTRRRPLSLVRETRFVEIGPVTAFRRDAAAALTPFPPLRYGWGLDLHWPAVAAEHGWRLGVVDAVPVRHASSPVASSYPREDATDEAREFLSARPHIDAAEARRTLAKHRTARP